MIRLGKKITIPSKMYMREFAISIFINELRYWYRHPVLDDTELYLEHIRYNKEIVEIKIKEKKRFIGNRHLLPPSNISKKKGNFPPMKSFDAVFIIFIPCVVIWKSNFAFELWSLQHVYILPPTIVSTSLSTVKHVDRMISQFRMEFSVNIVSKYFL